MDDRQYNNDGFPNDPAQDDFGPVPSYMERRPRRRVAWARLAVVLMVLGVVLYAAGFMSGARGGNIYFSNGRFHISAVNASDEGSASMTVDPFHSVDIHAGSSRVVIAQGNNYGVVVPTGWREPTVDVTGGVLVIDARRQGRSNIQFFGITNSTGENNDVIRVYVPDNSLVGGEIRVTTSSGRISIDRVNVGNIFATASSGRIEVSNISTFVSRMELRSSSGRVTVENVPDAGDISIQTSSGRIDIDRAGWHSLTARASSGRINVTRGQEAGQAGHTNLQASSGVVAVEIAGRRSDYRYSLNVSSGNMRVDGDRISGRNFSGGTGDNEIVIRTSSGNIRLDFVR